MRVVVLDCLQPERLAQFWAQALHYRRVSPSGPYFVLVSDAEPGPDLVLQRVPEPKPGRTGCTWTFASPPSNPNSRGSRPSAPKPSPRAIRRGRRLLGRDGRPGRQRVLCLPGGIADVSRASAPQGNAAGCCGD
jgi:hypothetical protein